MRNNLKWEINRNDRDNDSPLLIINIEFNLKNNKHLKHLEFCRLPNNKNVSHFGTIYAAVQQCSYDITSVSLPLLRLPLSRSPAARADEC